MFVDQQYFHISVFLNDNRWTGKLLTFKMYCNVRFPFFGAGKCHHQAFLKTFRRLYFFNASIIQTTIFNLGSSREGLPAILTDSGLDSRLRVVTTEKSISLGCTQIKMPGPWKEKRLYRNWETFRIYEKETRLNWNKNLPFGCVLWQSCGFTVAKGVRANSNLLMSINRGTPALFTRKIS